MSDRPKLYGNRNPIAQGQHFLNHMEAMTAENLHSKAAIAEELAHRDIQIAELQAAVEVLKNDLAKRTSALMLMTVERDQLKSWQENVLAEVDPIKPAVHWINDIPIVGGGVVNAAKYWSEKQMLHLAAKLVEAKSWQRSILDGYNGSAFVSDPHYPVLKLGYDSNEQAEAAQDAIAKSIDATIKGSVPPTDDSLLKSETAALANTVAMGKRIAELESWQESMVAFLNFRMVKVESSYGDHGWVFKNMPLYGETPQAAVESAMRPAPTSGEQS